MDGLFTLLSLCLVMAVASFLAGSLPLSFSLSTSQLRLVSMVGMGVLVGTSLIVIIPEGVETLYSAQSVAHSPKRDLLIRAPITLDQVLGESWLAPRDIGGDPFDLPGPVIPEGNIDPPKTPMEPGVIGALGGKTDDVDTIHDNNADKKPDEDHHDSAHHAWIGVALISGFILMYIIDKLPHHMTISKPTQHRYHIALNELGRGFQRTSADEDEDENFMSTQDQSQQTRSFATTTGLVIHAAADGIALGASSSAKNTSLSFIIFLAIMVHKAPAAFGLTSVLLKQGLSKRSARGHLVLFSLAAPLGAILTWTLAQFLGFSGLGNEETRGWWTGMLLLFSGGTFLYVAMQTMQGMGSSHGSKHTNGHANGYLDNRDHQQVPEKPELRDLLASVFGMILPLFLQIGHAH